MIKQINQVKEFHEKFGIPVANQVTFSDLDMANYLKRSIKELENDN